MVTLQIVQVLWADAHAGEAGWCDFDDFVDDGEVLVYSVGYLIPLGEKGSKAEHVTLWQSVGGFDGFNSFHIPVGMVRKVTILGSATIEVSA